MPQPRSWLHEQSATAKPWLWGIIGGKGSQVQGRSHSKKTGSMGKDQQGVTGNLANHICRVRKILFRTLPESAILSLTILMVTRGSAFPRIILMYHPPLQDQAESGNKGMKMPTNSTKTSNTTLMPMAEEQTADKSGGWGAKGFPSSYITDHQDGNNSEPSFGEFTGGLKMPTPDDHTSDGNGHSLQSHNSWWGSMMHCPTMKRLPPILPSGSSCSSHSPS